MASSRKEHRDEARLQIMRIIAECPSATTRHIANRVGISNGSAHYVLNALIEKGFVKVENFSRSADRRKYIYVLTPEGLSEKLSLTYRFIKRKRQEFDALKEELRSLEREARFASDRDDQETGTW